jgi:hypothetical protein
MTRRPKGTFDTLDHWVTAAENRLPAATGRALRALALRVRYKRPHLRVPDLMLATEQSERTCQRALADLVERGMAASTPDGYTLTPQAATLAATLPPKVRQKRRETAAKLPQECGKIGGDDSQEARAARDSGAPEVGEGVEGREETTHALPPTGAGKGEGVASFASSQLEVPQPEQATPLGRTTRPADARGLRSQIGAPPPPMNALGEALALVWIGLNTDTSTLTGTEIETCQAAAASLARGGFTASDVPEIGAWLRTTEKWRTGSLTPETIAKNASRWRNSATRAATRWWENAQPVDFEGF